MAVGDKSHLYAAAGLPVNTYVPSGQVNENKSHLAFQNQNNLFADDGIDWVNPDLTYTPNPGDSIYKDSTGNYVSQADYEKAMSDRYANTVINAEGDKGYTGQGAAGGRNPITTPTPTPTPNTGGGSVGRAVAGTSIPQVVLNPQDLSQRTPSGSMYAPDLSAYNDSSLFNYTGPGGVNEYTYGQNLPYQGAGYDIWGSPTDVPNPYFWGQFGEEPVAPEPQGPADGAIGLPPIDLPAGVAATNNNPNVGTNTTNITTGGGTGPGGQDLTYAQTLAEMGINPADAPSTTFPSPGDNTAPVVNPGQTLTERQLAEMSPEQIVRMNQILADEARMQQGQLGNVPSIFDSYRNEDGTIEDVQKTIFDSYGDEDADFDAAGYNNFDMGDDGPFEYDDYLARKVGEGMGENLQELIDKGKSLQDRYDAFEAPVIQDNIFNQHFDRNQAEYSAPLFQGDPIEAAIDLEYPGAKQITDFVDAIDGDTNAYKKILAQDGQISSGRGGIPVEMPIISDGDSENLFQMQGTKGLPDKGSYAGSSAGLGGGDVTEGGKKGFSGKTASDIADIQNLSDSTGMSAGEIAAGTGVASVAALTPELVRQRNADIKMVEKFVKNNKAAGSKNGYLTKEQWAKTNGSKLPNKVFEKASGNKGSIIKWLTSRTSPAHFGPVEKAIKVGSKILPPLATAGLVYGAGKGSYDLTNAAIDKLGVRDNLFDIGASVADSVQARKETKKRIETEKSEGTFKPRVTAPAKKAEAKKKVVKKATPKRVTVNYNKNRPVAVKSKPTRTPVPKVTRTTGSRGGRGNVSKKRKTYTSRGGW